MKKWYFTYGSGGDMPFEDGWTIIYAETLAEAQKKHIGRYGLSKGGSPRYAFSYSEEEFNDTIMAIEGNFGVFTQEEII